MSILKIDEINSTAFLSIIIQEEWKGLTPPYLLLAEKHGILGIVVLSANFSCAEKDKALSLLVLKPK